MYRAFSREPSMPSVLPAHLRRLEAESIHIMREVVAEMRNPVMLYSIGKDFERHASCGDEGLLSGQAAVSAAARRYDLEVPRDDRVPRRNGAPAWPRSDRPHQPGRGEARHFADRLGLAAPYPGDEDRVARQALDSGGFDAAFGGARRDEEKSRAKERIFSHRSAAHAWDPRNQRPELWRLFNTRIREGESLRVFPLSNWTELDVWEYVLAEDIPVVPLYFSKLRPVVERSGALIMVDDERLPLMPGEQPTMRRVRFRTLGCYPLTGAIESEADTLRDIIAEMRKSTTSERQGRLIDSDEASSMEKKKREGYF